MMIKNLFKIPEDLDIIEKYMFDFNCFISSGGKLSCLLNVYFDNKKTSISEIGGVAQSFRKLMMQFLQLAHFDATSPIQVGTVTGSVKSMAESPDFHEFFKTMFNLKHLDLW